jgi:hypothetical protein
MLEHDVPTRAAMQAFAALFEGDDGGIRGDLEAWGIDPERIRMLPQWNSTTEGFSLPRPRNEVAATAERVLRGALDLAAPRPLGAATVGLFTHFVCEQEWEVSYQYFPIFTTLKTLQSVWRSRRHLALSADDAAAMDAVCEMLHLLDKEMSAESQMCVGALGPFADAVEEAHRAAADVVGAAAAIETASSELAELLTRHGRNRQRYYELVSLAVRTGTGYLAGEAGAIDLDQAILQLRVGDRDELLEENDRSEVRAHRLSLEAMRSRAEDPWLQVDHGKITYVYPFGLRETDSLGLDQTDFTVIVDRVRAEAKDWTLAGVAVDYVEPELRLDNMWAAQPLEVGPEHLQDGQRGSRLSGATIKLPDLRISLNERVLTEVTAEIVVSDLGNHHVRFEAELRGASPHEVQFELFRAAPQHGGAQVGFIGGIPAWSRLSEVAAELIRSVHRQINEPSKQFILSAQAGTFHVVLSVHSASTTIGPAGTVRTPVSSAREVIAATGGGTLLSPVRNAVTSFAEWTKHNPNAATIVPGVGFVTDVVARTANTTVLVMPGTPDWNIDTYRGIAEFVASLDGLVFSWFDELNTHLKLIRSITGQIDSEARPSTRTIEAFNERLRDEQVRLQNFVAEARSLQQLLRSPVLVESPLDAEILRKLMSAAQFERVEDDFADKARELLEDRLGSRLTDIADRRERKRRAALEMVVAFVTAAGVSGLVQVFEGGGSVGWSRTQSAAVAAGVLIGAVVTVLAAYFVGGRRKGR